MIREIINLAKKKEAIVFYAEHGDYYPCLEGFVKRLGNVSYITSDPRDSILLEPWACYMNKLFPLFAAFTNCKVMVMTMLDLNQFHIRRSINPVHYVYVFHAPISVHRAYKFGAFDYYDSILCIGPYHIKEIRRQEKLYGLKPKKLIEAGYPKLERLYEACKKYDKKDKEITILVAPTWGATNLMEICGQELLEILLRSGYRVILRLHPETVKRHQFAKYNGVMMETSVANIDSLVEADVLITDWSGVGIEYAFGTERPVIFIDTPPKIRNPRYGELKIEPVESYLRNKIGVIVSPDKIGNISSSIESLVEQRGEYRERIIKLRGNYVFNFGKVAEVGANYIKGLL